MGSGTRPTRFLPVPAVVAERVEGKRPRPVAEVLMGAEVPLQVAGVPTADEVELLEDVARSILLRTARSPEAMRRRICVVQPCRRCRTTLQDFWRWNGVARMRS
jgi:hypothetical protein